jgi:hypothetical protein
MEGQEDSTDVVLQLTGTVARNFFIAPKQKSSGKN